MAENIEASSAEANADEWASRLLEALSSGQPPRNPRDLRVELALQSRLRRVMECLAGHKVASVGAEDVELVVLALGEASGLFVEPMPALDENMPEDEADGFLAPADLRRMIAAVALRVQWE